MSGVNITCSIGNQLGNGGGEMKFNVDSKDASTLATCIATEIVNEILDSALDLASLRSTHGLECDTIAFSVDDGLCRFATNDAYRENFRQTIKTNSFSSYPEVLTEECPDIREIIDGLSSIHVPDQNAEEPLHLDIEMKRLLSEMMSPPYEIVNYETLPRKDGVGDQPIVEIAPKEDVYAEQSDESLVDPEKSKIVEKKSRVTDLVMNSKQVLSEYLMTDESRKEQEEWEESNEKVLQIIELDQCESIKEEDEENTIETKIGTQDQEEVDGFTSIPVDDCMDTIELNSVASKDAAKSQSKDKLEYGGDDSNEITPGSSQSQSVDLVTGIKEVKCKNKFELFMKRKWNINLKLFGIGKKKRALEKEEKNAL